MQEIVIAHERMEVVMYTQDNFLRLYGIFPENVSKSLRKRAPDFCDLRQSVETEIHCTGEDLAEFRGIRLIGGNPGRRLVYKGLSETIVNGNREVVLSYNDSFLNLQVESRYILITSVPVIRRTVSVKNIGHEPVGLEHVFSAVINGVGLGGEREWFDKMILHLPYASWSAEGQWESGRLDRFGLYRPISSGLSRGAIQISQTGTWSSLNYLPMAIIEDEESGSVWYWQVEHNGSWSWEISNLMNGSLYINIGGPNEEKNHWWKSLGPGEVFETVPVAVGTAEGGFDDAVRHLSSYRRIACLRPHQDNVHLPVIFNDYMNCLYADPTTEKELPLIEAAAKAGCEYYVVDAGWYAGIGENWWPTIGLWHPNSERFPGGFEEVCDKIRSQGMIPGLWLEIEMVGASGPMTERPDSWFMMRHGKRVIDNGRLILDFRNPEVCEYTYGVVDRVINDYGIGYIKNDCNVTARMGTETNADSFGDGLLQHNRAFLTWLDKVADRHPKLVIENCSSGGLRMDYATLSRCQVQSSSDQTNYKYYPPILSGTMAACLPEQLAVWSYPLKDGDIEETIFNMVNVMLSRIHLSGQIADISEECFKYVREAISTYKKYRQGIPKMIPFWPVGTITQSNRNAWFALGLKHQTESWALLAVWRLGSTSAEFDVPLCLKGKEVLIEQIFPADGRCRYSYNRESGSLVVSLDQPWTARLFKLDI